jgi:peptidoglycan/LPS O-acetylase OafA/YrhL/glycosyltransferase involved in cell wall biosynthesis
VSSGLDPGKEARSAGGIPVVPSFDGYRAIAILLIVVYHVSLFSGLLYVAGDSWRGVVLAGALPGLPLTMLFIVSGFVLYLPTATRGGEFGNVADYALRRAARILPAYWVSLVVGIVLLAVLQDAGKVPGLSEVLLHLTMLQTPASMLDGGFHLGFGIVGSVWTLSVETGFYLLLPLIAGVWFRRPFAGLAAAAASLVLWRLFALHIGDIGSFFGIGVSDAAASRWATDYASQLPSWGLSFAVGMTGAWVFVRLRDRFGARALEGRAALACVLSCVLAAVLIVKAGHDAIEQQTLLGGLFARQSLGVALLLPLAVGTAMISLALCRPAIQRPFANEPLRALGDVSYGVYLIHLAVIAVVVDQLDLSATGSIGDFAVWMLIVLGASLVYSYASAVLLERPIRRWARRVRPGGARANVEVSAPDPSLPAVSIVIPTYNRADWLGGALDSVLAQDYGNLEALVVDDGSSDGTQALLKRYAKRWPEHRFRSIRQENAGQARALNRGNAQARGEILGYLSDDDELLPGAVTRLAAELIGDPGAAVAFPGYREIDGEGVVTNTVRPIEYDSLSALRLHDTVIGPGGLARREALERAGGWDPSLRWLGDLILWIGAGTAGRVVRVPEPLALWRRHPGSATVQLSAEHAREHLRCAEIGASFPGIGPLSDDDRAEALRNACIFAALFGGGADWPGERFIIFDLHRRLTSAATSKLGPDGAIDWLQAERAAALYRELVELTVPASATAGSGGLRRARERLAEVGALPGDGPASAAGGKLTLALVEAAFACGADIDQRRARFIVCDLRLASISDDDMAELTRVGFNASAEELAEAVARHRGG